MAPLLLVDGDRNFRQALAIALKLEGIDVASCGSADEALDWLALSQFRLCVVDCLAPGADRLLDELHGAAMGVIATCTYPELLSRAVRRHPRFGTLPKPFGARELAQRVHEQPSRPTS